MKSKAKTASKLNSKPSVIGLFLDQWAFWVGLFLTFAYWWLVHPLGFANGYLEDFCVDIVRQVMAENLDKFGHPAFHSDSFMAPGQASMPYMSWSIERDWFGAYVWKWSTQFPFLWTYFGASLLVSYLGVGSILKKMKLSAGAAWSLATVAVLFHIPRHFKIWHHSEHLMQHWVYLSIFFDAWIWQRFWRERKWTLSFEGWRGVLLLCGLLSTGYFWGPLILEWVILRLCLGLVLIAQRKSGSKIKLEFDWSKVAAPLISCVALFILELRWFLPLYEESKVSGEVFNNMAWFTPGYHAFRPVWLDYFLSEQNKMYGVSETVVTFGWLILIPFFIALWAIRKKKKGPGIIAVLPFLIFVFIGFTWLSRLLPISWIEFLRNTVPFLIYFRVASRWALILPSCFFAVIALSWPELSQRLKEWSSSKAFRRITVVFIVSSLAEVAWLFHPVNMMPPIPQGFANILEDIRKRPGEMVLDLPFCVAGGNGVCTSQQCPNYPNSTVGLCLRAIHHKKVHGLYQARMNYSHCDNYNHEPYLSWFSAWGEQRCFSEKEWAGFCSYLDQNSIAAILLYPDTWVAASRPECFDQFKAHLGMPLDQAVIPKGGTWGGEWKSSQNVLYFAPKCIRK